MATQRTLACPICASTEYTSFLTVPDYSISKESFDVGTCVKCNMTVTFNAPEPKDIGPYYASDVYISHSDTRKTLMDKIYHWVRERMLIRKSSIVKKYTEKQTGNLLDIGSGTGYFPAHMKTLGWKVEGVEIDETTRKKSIENFEIDVKPPSYIQALPQNYFDAITMWHVLEHVEETDRYLTQIHQALTEKGALIIAVPNRSSWDAKKYKEHWAAYDVPRHLWHFQPGDMERLADKHGFRVDKILGMPMDAFYVSLLSEKYLKRSFPMVRGFISGLISNLSAWGSPEKSSSVIYILKK